VIQATCPRSQQTGFGDLRPRRILDLRKFARLFVEVPEFESNGWSGGCIRLDNMPDRRTPEPVDALATFASETDGSQPAVAPTPLRRPWDGSPLAAMPSKDERGGAFINSVQALADRVDALSITVIATTERLERWIIGLAVLTGLLVLALLAQTYLWMTVAVAGR
jgi:hypothetical protein